MSETRIIRVAWDPDACVYCTEGGDIPRLNTEADSFDALVDRATAVLPELLRAERLVPVVVSPVVVSFVLERSQVIVVA